MSRNLQWLQKKTPSNPLGSTSKTDNDDDSVGKTDNPIKCDMCKKMFKSSDNLQTHIEKKGTKDKFYKGDKCNSTFARKSEVLPHINETNKKCNICERKFTNTTVLQTHMKAIHKKELPKHKLEREPSLKNHKIKKI